MSQMELWMAMAGPLFFRQFIPVQLRRDRTWDQDDKIDGTSGRATSEFDFSAAATFFAHGNALVAAHLLDSMKFIKDLYNIHI